MFTASIAYDDEQVLRQVSITAKEGLLSDYSMVFRDVVLFDDTVMENIRLGKHGATSE